MKKTGLFFLALYLLTFITAPASLAAPTVSEDASTRLVLQFSPEKIFPGDAVTVSAKMPDGSLSMRALRWEWRGGIGDLRKVSDEEIAYEAQNTPATLSATLWDRLSGEDLDTATVTLTPESYMLSIASSSEDLVEIQTWDETKLKLASLRGLATGTYVQLEAMTTPNPKGALRYVWTTNDGTFLASQDKNRCSVYRDSTGTAIASVALLDKHNVELASADLRFDVALSPETIERSARLVKGNESWQKALSLRGKGDIESAFAQAQQAAADLAAGGVNPASLSEELERFRQARENYFKSLELGAVAASLWRDGKLEPALGKYREAQTLHPSAETENSMAKIGALIAQEKDTSEKATVLAQEAELLAKEDKLAEALQKYGESLSLKADPAVRSARAAVEGSFKATQRKMELAKSLHEIALTLEGQGDLESSLSKMAEARAIWALPESQADMQRVQSALQNRLDRQTEAVRLTHEASALEGRGGEGQGDPAVLSEALEKYREAHRVYPDISLERSIKRVKEQIDRIDAQVAEAAFLTKEAEVLEQGERLSEALEKYRRSLDLRRYENIERKVEGLAQTLETRRRQQEDSRKLLNEAQSLEKQEKIDDALELARKAEAAFPGNDVTATIKRLETAIATREGKILRAKELAQQAQATQAAGETEKALDLYLESNNVWSDDSVAQAIRTLQGQVDQNRDTEQRSIDLYKEGVARERESVLDVAEEKLQASLALKHTPEAERLLERVRKRRAEEAWIATLKSQPLTLTSIPLVPRAGQKTILRLAGGAWGTDENLSYRWKLVGNTVEGAEVDGGRAYSFYPADAQPVTATLTIFQKGTDRELTHQKLSIIAQAYDVKLALDESRRVSQRWDTAQKRLEEIPEFATLTDIPVRVEIAPLPDESVVYFWATDTDSAIADSRKHETTVKRLMPGTTKVSVTAKDSRNIVLGSAELSFIVSVDKSDILKDTKRAQAWDEWRKASSLWTQGKRLLAIDTAARASLLDPEDPGITNGLSQMKEDLGKMEYSARLLAESSALLADGKTDEAAEKIAEAEKLWPGETVEAMKAAMKETDERVKADELVALRLQAEGEAFLARGNKPEALLRFRSSVLLKENEAITQEVRRLEEELKQEKTLRDEARELRTKGDALADKKRYSGAVELYLRSLKLYPDPSLEAYAELLKERAAGEKVLKEEASKLRKAGDELAKAKKVEESLVKYRQSLEIWHDDALADMVKTEESRIAQARASALRKEAENLIKAKKAPEALGKYQESLKYAYDATADAYVRKTLAEAAKKKATALIKEGDALVKQKKPEEALSRYKAALKETPGDSELVEKARKLEMILTPAVETGPAVSKDIAPVENNVGENASDDIEKSLDLVQADALFREANLLYNQKKYKEALVKYTESYKLSQNQKLKEFIDQLEETLKSVEEASKLVQEGNALYKAQKYEEALLKYRESLKLHRNPEVEAFIPKVEALLK